MYTIDDIGQLINRARTDKQYSDYLDYYYKKNREELCVHTQGRLFDKVWKVFSNEEPESQKYVLDTYENITKGSIWRGIDNLSRIFNNTGFDITGDNKTIELLTESGFFRTYVNDFINISTAYDPNSVQVWMLEEDGKTWESKFISTEFIKIINKDEICFIDLEHSEYTIEKKAKKVGSITNYYNDTKNIRASYFEGVEYVFGDKIKYIYINKDQYITIDADKDKATASIINFGKKLKSPYTYTGVEKITEGVYHSAVAGFIPFGNHSLIQHRTFRSVEALFGYPRMSEVELPCEHCVRGEETCDPCDEFPDGTRPCRTCGGSGNISMQSPFKIYKRKLFPDVPELNANIKPVEFFTPDIGILNYNAEAWKKSLQMAEDAIYIQQRVETGNVESAKSREKQLESMYAWLGRISSVIYDNIQDAIDNFSAISNTGSVSVNKPLSFAIMNELEAFDYLNSIVATDAPVFIKTVHTENFLNKYISRTSPVIKIVDILKRVDLFVFYSIKDLQTLSDSGVINDTDWRTHSYAYPILMQLYTREPDLFDKDYAAIEARLMLEINKKQPNFMEAVSSSGSSSETLKGSVGGLTGMIEIAKAVASGLYDLEAAVALVSDRFGLTEEQARKQLGTPQTIQTQQQADKVSTLV